MENDKPINIPLIKHKPLQENRKVDVTGKGQTLEELMKALGLPPPKKKVVEESK